MKLVDKIISWGLYLFIILLPWQTRWIFKDVSINGGVFEYGRLSLYASEIILLVILFLGLIRFRNSKTYFWIGWLAVWSALTILWSEEKILASYGWLKLAEGISLFWLINQQKHRQGLSFSLIISGLIQAAFGIYQFLNQGIVGANKWLGLAMINSEAAGTSVIEFLDQRWLRAYGSLPHPNILGGFLAVCLLVLVIKLVKEQQVNKHLRYFYWLAAIITFFGLITTFSRSAWLGFGLTFICLLVYHLVKKIKERRSTVLSLTAVFIIISLVFLIVFPYQLITGRIKSDSRLEQKSLAERQVVYEQFGSVIKGHWYQGTGPGNYLMAVRELQPDLAWYDYQPVHDSGLLTFAELGVIGLILFILVIIYVLRNKSDYWPLVIAILVIGLFDHYFRSLYFGIILWWLVMALAYRPKLD